MQVAPGKEAVSVGQVNENIISLAKGRKTAKPAATVNISWKSLTATNSNSFSLFSNDFLRAVDPGSAESKPHPPPLRSSPATSQPTQKIPDKVPSEETSRSKKKKNKRKREKKREEPNEENQTQRTDKGTEIPDVRTEVMQKGENRDLTNNGEEEDKTQGLGAPPIAEESSIHAVEGGIREEIVKESEESYANAEPQQKESSIHGDIYTEHTPTKEVTRTDEKCEKAAESTSEPEEPSPGTLRELWNRISELEQELQKTKGQLHDAVQLLGHFRDALNGSPLFAGQLK